MIRRNTSPGLLAHVHALLMALVLVLQTAFGAYAAGAMPAGPLLDIFGNPLCITDPAHGESGGDNHKTLPNCCTFGCPAGAFTPTPVNTATLAAPRIEWHVVRAIAVDVAPVHRLHDNARHPRAPPTLT